MADQPSRKSEDSPDNPPDNKIDKLRNVASGAAKQANGSQKPSAEDAVALLSQDHRAVEQFRR